MPTQNLLIQLKYVSKQKGFGSHITISLLNKVIENLK